MVAALLLVQLFFGLHYFAAKVVLMHLEPRAWAVLRVAGAAVVLLGAAMLLRRPLPRSPGDLGRLAFFSIFGVVVNQVCFVEGLYRTTVTHSSIINTIIPIGTLLFAALMGHERVGGTRVAAMLVAFAGVLLVIRPEAASWSSEALAGDLLTLVNALSYSLFLALSKRTLDRLDPLAATAVLMAFGAAGILLVGGRTLAATDLGAVPGSAWALGAGIVLLPTAGAYFLIYWALGKTDPSVVAVSIYLQPLIASALSIAFLGERPDTATLLGAGLIFLGVYLGSRASRAKSSTPTLRADSSMSNRGEWCGASMPREGSPAPTNTKAPGNLSRK